MNSISVNMNATHDYLTVIVFRSNRFHRAFCPTLRRFLPCSGGIIYPERYRFYAIAVFIDMISYRVIGS